MLAVPALSMFGWNAAADAPYSMYQDDGTFACEVHAWGENSMKYVSIDEPRIEAGSVTLIGTEEKHVCRFRCRT